LQSLRRNNFQDSSFNSSNIEQSYRNRNITNLFPRKKTQSSLDPFAMELLRLLNTFILLFFIIRDSRGWILVAQIVQLVLQDLLQRVLPIWMQIVLPALIQLVLPPWMELVLPPRIQLAMDLLALYLCLTWIINNTNWRAYFLVFQMAQPVFAATMPTLASPASCKAAETAPTPNQDAPPATSPSIGLIVGLIVPALIFVGLAIFFLHRKHRNGALEDGDSIHSVSSRPLNHHEGRALGNYNCFLHRTPDLERRPPPPPSPPSGRNGIVGRDPISRRGATVNFERTVMPGFNRSPQPADVNSNLVHPLLRVAPQQKKTAGKTTKIGNQPRRAKQKRAAKLRRFFNGPIKRTSSPPVHLVRPFRTPKAFSPHANKYSRPGSGPHGVVKRKSASMHRRPSS
jgi:hypothetical protein